MDHSYNKLVQYSDPQCILPELFVAELFVAQELLYAELVEFPRLHPSSHLEEDWTPTASQNNWNLMKTNLLLDYSDHLNTVIFLNG
jgi:hypothetical protein